MILLLATGDFKCHQELGEKVSRFYLISGLLDKKKRGRDFNQKLFIKLTVQNRRPSVHQSPLPTTKPRIIRNGHLQRVEKLIPIQLKSRSPPTLTQTTGSCYELSEKVNEGATGSGLSYQSVSTQGSSLQVSVSTLHTPGAGL